MTDSKRKKFLDAALNTLLAVADTTWWTKGPVTFISELSARFGDLPDDQRAALAEATPEAFSEALTQLGLATEHAAFAAAGVVRIEDRIRELFEIIQMLFLQSGPHVYGEHDLRAQQEAVMDPTAQCVCTPRSSPPLDSPDPMTTDLRTRIENLLCRSDEWVSWSTALIGAHSIGEYRRTHQPHHIYSHVDTSEIVEYLLPNTEISMQVRVSLELLFASSGFPLYLLPMHADELNHYLQARHHRACVFLQGTRALNNTVQRVLKGAIAKLKDRPRAELCEAAAKLITDNVPPIEALEADRNLSALNVLDAV